MRNWGHLSGRWWRAVLLAVGECGNGRRSDSPRFAVTTAVWAHRAHNIESHMQRCSHKVDNEARSLPSPNRPSFCHPSFAVPTVDSRLLSADACSRAKVRRCINISDCRNQKKVQHHPTSRKQPGIGPRVLPQSEDQAGSVYQDQS